MKKIITITALLFSIGISQAQIHDTIVKWTFPTGNATDTIANGGIPANLSKVIKTVGGTSVLLFPAGATTKSASATKWDNGSGTKYWQVSFTTKGYDSLFFTSKQRSSSTGPRDFKVQYRLGSTGTWSDVQNAAVIDTADNFVKGFLTDSLPVVCNNNDSVYLRWIMTSNISAKGGTVGSTGTSSIDDIIICGHNISGIEPPVVNNVYVNTLSEVKVVFSKAVNAATGEDVTNYTGLGTISSAVRSVSLDTVTLNLASPLINGNAYTLTVSNVQDTTSNNTPMPTAQSFNFLFNNSKAPIVITEIMYNPPESGTDSLEFVELYNNSSITVLVGGYFFKVGTTSQNTYYAFPAGMSMAPNAYIVLARNPITVDTFYHISGTIAWASGQALNNTNTKLQIVNSIGEYIDSLTYKTTAPWPTSSNGNGPSLTLCDPNSDNSNGLNWQASAEFIDSLNGKAVMANPGTGCITTNVIELPEINDIVNCFPNPVKEILTLTFEKQADKIEIFDMFGNIAYTITEPSLVMKINTENLKKGIYCIKVFFKDHSIDIKKISVI